jgi:hypothetical protein
VCGNPSVWLYLSVAPAGVQPEWRINQSTAPPLREPPLETYKNLPRTMIVFADAPADHQLHRRIAAQFHEFSEPGFTARAVFVRKVMSCWFMIGFSSIQFPNLSRFQLFGWGSARKFSALNCFHRKTTTSPLSKCFTFGMADLATRMSGNGSFSRRKSWLLSPSRRPQTTSQTVGELEMVVHVDLFTCTQGKRMRRYQEAEFLDAGVGTLVDFVVLFSPHHTIPTCRSTSARLFSLLESKLTRHVPPAIPTTQNNNNGKFGVIAQHEDSKNRSSSPGYQQQHNRIPRGQGLGQPSGLVWSRG